MNKKRGRRHNTRRNVEEKSDLEAVVEDFVACGRCSFFLAGYRVIHGVDALEEAAQESDGEWLILRWDHATRRLVQDSYGSRLDIEFYYYDGRCPECQRRFVIRVEEEGSDPPESEVDGSEEHEWELQEPTTLSVALTGS